RLRHPVAWEVYASSTVGFHTEKYVHKQTAKLFQGGRADDRTQVFLGLDRKFGDYVTVTLGYLWTDNHSSVELYDYNRDVWSVGVALKF
ncbi:MAG: hypothetical protein HZA54_12035, partial [Planctomycetes bacterium]|nr:hypothetical protein [Planctomycetota bacterium]